MRPRGACGPAPAAPSTGRSSSYISRTFPLATRGRSASLLTRFDATSAFGRRSDGGRLRRRRVQAAARSGGGVRGREHDVEAADDLLGIADVVLVGEDL